MEDEKTLGKRYHQTLVKKYLRRLARKEDKKVEVICIWLARKVEGERPGGTEGERRPVPIGDEGIFVKVEREICRALSFDLYLGIDEDRDRAPVRVLTGPPKLGERQAEGVFGVVYRQGDRAIKYHRRIRTLGYSDPVLRELAILQQHIPGLVPLLEIWIWEDEVYSVMPWCGDKLELEHYPQVETAVDNLHRAGFLHNDIKVENILVAGKTAYLGDLGLATLSSREEDRVADWKALQGIKDYLDEKTDLK